MEDQATVPANFMRYYNEGLSVFPVPPLTKTATIPWAEYQTSLANPFDVQEWVRSHYNIGVATGALSGVFVLDLDNRETLDWLKLHRELPATVTVATPRGFHLYYQHPGWRVKNRAGLHTRDAELPEGIDIRGDGGFAMGAGSYYLPSEEDRAKGKREGSYRFVAGSGLGECEIAPAPAWLLELLYDPPYVAPDLDDRPIPDAYAARALEGELEAIAIAPGGTRNDQVNRSAFALGTLVAAGVLSRARVEHDLVHAARQVGQSADEARNTVRSGLVEGMKHPRQLVSREGSTDAVAAPLAASVASPPLPAATPAKSFAAGAFRASDVATIDAPEQEWVVDDLIPRGHVTTLFGDGGVGKSLLVQTIASHVASGEPFADRPVTKMRAGAMMCEDDAAELNRRQRRINGRLFDANEVEGFSILSRIGEDNVLGMVDKGRWEATKVYSELVAWVEQEGIQLLFIDNIMQVYGGDINDNQAATWFLNSLTRLARRMGGAVVLLGHVAKSENSRFSGSMAWNNAVRCRLNLSKIDPEPGQPERRLLTVDKSNYGRAGIAIELALHEGVLIDRRSLSPEELDATSERQRRARTAVMAVLGKVGSISLSHQSPAYVFSPATLAKLRQAGAPVERDVRDAIAVMLADGVLKKESREWSDGAKKKRERIVLAQAAEPVLERAPRTTLDVLDWLNSPREAA